MPSEKELIMYQKSTVLDLLAIIERDPNRSYSTKELKELLMAYVKGLEQK